MSLRLIKEMHATILDGVRGRTRQPGELRTAQNWIGAPGATIETATFVPPPPDELGTLMSDLERFIHEEPVLPPLVQAALVHYQFETIHPFNDGNGRLGRRDREPSRRPCLRATGPHGQVGGVEPGCQPSGRVDRPEVAG